MRRLEEGLEFAEMVDDVVEGKRLGNGVAKTIVPTAVHRHTSRPRHVGADAVTDEEDVAGLGIASAHSLEEEGLRRLLRTDVVRHEEVGEVVEDTGLLQAGALHVHHTVGGDVEAVALAEVVKRLCDFGLEDSFFVEELVEEPSHLLAVALKTYGLEEAGEDKIVNLLDADQFPLLLAPEDFADPIEDFEVRRFVVHALSKEGLPKCRLRGGAEGQEGIVDVNEER